MSDYRSSGEGMLISQRGAEFFTGDSEESQANFYTCTTLNLNYAMNKNKP